MGRKTFQSIGKPLPGRTKIVLTRDPGVAAPGVRDGAELRRRARAARGDAQRRGVDADHGDRRRRHLSRKPCRWPTALEITRVHAAPEGDAVFRRSIPALWRETRRAGTSGRPGRRRRVHLRRPIGVIEALMRRDASTSRAPLKWRRNPTITPCQNDHRRRHRSGRSRRTAMPWSNQSGGGGPWGSGGPRGRGARVRKSSGADAARSRGTAAPQPGQAAAVLPGGGLGGKGVASSAWPRWCCGAVRLLPRRARRGRRRPALRPARPDASSRACNYHLPYPIETVLTPRVTRQQRPRSACARSTTSRRGGTHPRRAGGKPDAHRRREHRRHRFHGAVADQATAQASPTILFNIQNPDGTVKAVAESAMREVIGRSNIQPILTGARQNDREPRCTS